MLACLFPSFLPLFLLFFISKKEVNLAAHVFFLVLQAWQMLASLPVEAHSFLTREFWMIEMEKNLSFPRGFSGCESKEVGLHKLTTSVSSLNSTLAGNPTFPGSLLWRWKWFMGTGEGTVSTLSVSWAGRWAQGEESEKPGLSYVYK